AIAPPGGLTIECTSGSNVSGNIRDMDSKFPFTTGQALDLNCVVEIARIVGIDRNDELIAQIFTLCVLTRVDSFWNLRCLLQGHRRKTKRQMIFPDNRQHVDTRIRRPSKQLDQFAFRINVPRIPGLQPNDYLVAGNRRPGRMRDRSRLDINVVHDPWIIRHNIKEIPRLLQGPDDRFVRPFQNADDSSFRAADSRTPPPSMRLARNSRHHAISIHRRSGVLRGNEDVAADVSFSGDKAESRGMNLNPASYEVGLSRKDVAILANARDLTDALEFAQNF